MKSIVIIIFFMIFSACGRKHENKHEVIINDKEDNQQNDENILIECLSERSGIQTIIICNGREIARIEDGKDGKNGSSCSVSEISGGSLISCEDGSEAFIKDGESCTVDRMEGGAVISCPDDSRSIILDGQDAELPEATIVEYVDPCGDFDGEFDEIILRMNNGSFVAYFEHGSTRFLSVLLPGSYITTDSQKCYFNIDNEGNINW